VAYEPPAPAIAPVQAQFLIDYNIGWNGGARAISTLPSSGRVQFKAPHSTIGAVAGLNDVDSDAGSTNMEHAWYVSNGQAKVLELGVEKYTHGAFTAGDLFAVERISGTVTYNVNGTTVYTSASTSFAPMLFDASLYVGDDYIYDPAIYEYITCSGSFEPLNSLSSSYTYSGASVSFPYITGTSDELYISAATFELLIGRSSDYDYSDSMTSIEPMEAYSYSGLIIPDLTVCTAYMQPLIGSSIELHTDMLSATVTLKPMIGLSSDYDYTSAIVEFELIESTSMERTNVDIEIPSWAFILTQQDVHSYKYLTFDNNMSVATLLTVELDYSLLMDSNISVSDAMTMVSDYNLLVNTFIQAGLSFPVFSSGNQFSGGNPLSGGNLLSGANPVSGANQVSSGNQVWVVSESGQTSRYENYSFNSFGKFNGQYYGAKQDGIYLLEGDTDQGSPVRSSINFGKQNFGTALKKRVSNCYIGISSTDKMYLKVTADGVEYIYEARGSSVEMETQRVDIGRGIRANFLVFELFNNDGCDFDFNSIEFVVFPSTTRRI